MDESVINSVLEHNNIVDVIGSYIPLKRAGSNYKARCPFHEEKTASFMVSEKKQIFKCFGCGKAGNVITFVRDYEKISFLEAVKKLAVRAGIPIKETKGFKIKRSKNELIYKIYSLTATFYRENLKLHGKVAMRYLENRRISQKSIDKFGIGYALDSFSGLKNYLLKNSINSKILEQTGLFKKNNNDIYDAFRNRLMFPIHSVNGKVVAFGGRILQKDQSGGKYINSPTTEIYTKGKELYGLYATRYEISKKGFALICEGYLDFLRLYESDFTNVVASLGTALTDSQINLLSRYTNNFYMIYDGDFAGIKAAVKAAGNVVKNGFSPKIIILPEKEDPDSFLLKFGKEKLEGKISKALGLTAFLKQNKSLKLESKEKIEQLLEIAGEIEDEIARELFIKEISTEFGLSESALLTKIRPKRKRNKVVEDIGLEKFPEERNLLKLILNDSSLHKKVALEVKSDYFFVKSYKEIYEKISEHADNLQKFSGLIDEMESDETKSLLAELLLEEVREMNIEEVLSSIKLRKYKRELDDINREIRNNTDNLELYKAKKELKKKILSLHKKVVNRTLY